MELEQQEQQLRQGHGDEVKKQESNLIKEPSKLEYVVEKLSPPQSKGEKYRDILLAALDAPFFQIIGIINLMIIIIDGAFFFFLLCGWQRLCFEPKRTDCSPRNELYNITIQILNVCFTYMAIVSMPWRCTNIIHLSGGACPRREYGDGLDLYGQRSNDIWFHIPRKTRVVIMVQLLFNCLFQFCNQASRIIYYSYELQNKMPGQFWTNIFFVLSMLTAFTGGVHLALEESKLRKKTPNHDFGLGPIDIIKLYIEKSKKTNKGQEDDTIEKTEDSGDASSSSMRQSVFSESLTWESSRHVLNFDRNAMKLFAM